MPTPVKAALISAVFLILLVIAVGNPSAFIHAGTMYSNGDLDGTKGYDGQFFFWIARDGFAGAAHIDGPVLRFMRIGYPATARILAAGFAGLVPLALIAVNIAAITATVYLLAKMIGWWSLAYLAYGGTLFAFRLDLAEPLCYLLILLAFVALEDDRPRRAIVWLMLGALTKELALVAAAAFALYGLLSGRLLRAAGLVALPLAAWLGWIIVLHEVFGVWPWIYPAAHLEFPGAGWLAITAIPDSILTGLWLALPALALVGITGAEVVLDGIRRDALLTGAGALFLLMAPRESWIDPVAALRIGGLMVLPGLIFLAAYPKLSRPVAALWALSGGLVLIVPGLFF